MKLQYSDRRKNLQSFLIILATNFWMLNAPVTSDGIWFSIPWLRIQNSEGFFKTFFIFWQSRFENGRPLLKSLNEYFWLLELEVSKITNIPWFALNYCASSIGIFIIFKFLGSSYSEIFKIKDLNLRIYFSIIYSFTCITTLGFFHDTYSVWWVISWILMIIPFVVIGRIYSPGKNHIVTLVLILIIANSYEGILITAPFLLFLYFHQHKDKRTKFTMIILAACSLLSTFYWSYQNLVHLSNTTYSGITAQYNPFKTTVAFFIQIIAVTPLFAQLRSLIDLFHVKEYIFDFSQLNFNLQFSQIIVLVYLIYSICISLKVLLVKPLKKSSNLANRDHEYLTRFGVSGICFLILIPIFMIAFSSKYIELLPRVFVSYLAAPSLIVGVSLLLLNFQKNRFLLLGSKVRKLLLSIVLVVVTINFLINSLSANSARITFDYIISFDKINRSVASEREVCSALIDIIHVNYAGGGIDTAKDLVRLLGTDLNDTNCELKFNELEIK